jgi:putative transposase
MVFVTVFRHRVFTDLHPTRMEEIMRGRVHRLRNPVDRVQRRKRPRPPAGRLPPEIALSKPVNSLKGVSSRRTRREFPELAAHYYRAGEPRSGSYFAGSVGGAPLSTVRWHIERRNRPV